MSSSEKKHLVINDFLCIQLCQIQLHHVVNKIKQIVLSEFVCNFEMNMLCHDFLRYIIVIFFKIISLFSFIMKSNNNIKLIRSTLVV